ncbi:MAG TPA: DUF6483 family protein [Ignavibacteria bacterium]|nr:DUF6483 family protein [Ignavibacteria bacterium]
MEQKDYLMRMTEEFTRVIAKVLFFRDTKQYYSAHLELDNVSKNVTGFSSNQLKALGPDGVTSVFDNSNFTNIEKVYYSAKIIMEEGFLFELEGKIDEGLDSYAIALVLFEYLKERGFTNDPDIDAEIKFIKKKIN